MSEDTKTETTATQTPTAGTPPLAETPSTVVAPAADTALYERRAQRRGCGVLVLSSILGALLGAVIALGALSAINGGTLAYNTGQIRRDIVTAQEVQSNLSSQLEEISGQLAEVNSQLDALTTQGNNATQTLSAAQENISQLQSDVSQIEADFATVIEASQAVDEFLAAFRVMLEALPPGTAVVPTATPLPSP